MNLKDSWYVAGVALMGRFCSLNGIAAPEVKRLLPSDRLYHLATCAYYRPHTISIMVEKCASPGLGGRAWSWPGYAIDRTPYGVIQHELGHHVDEVRSAQPLQRKDDMLSYRVYQLSQENPLTGYLGTDSESKTFFKEWFAENFRLFVTNPDLSRALRPKFYKAITEEGFKSPIGQTWGLTPWREILVQFNNAPPRIVEQAAKKVAAVENVEASQHFQQQYLGGFAERSPANTEGRADV